MPLGWKKEPTLLLYSHDGKTWKLPPDWGQVQGVRVVAKVAVDGITPGGAAEVKDGELTLALATGGAEVVTAR